MSRITMLLAFGAGYVVGARAGRERYREIRDGARAAWESDVVQEQATRAREATKSHVARAQALAKDRLPPRLGGHAPTDGDAAEPETVGAGAPGGTDRSRPLEGP